MGTRGLDIVIRATVEDGKIIFAITNVTSNVVTLNTNIIVSIIRQRFANKAIRYNAVELTN